MYLAFPFPKRRFKVHPAVVTLPKKPLSAAAQTADRVMALFQSAHLSAGGSEASVQGVQCAMLAMEEISDLPLIIGALLHNVGALLRVPNGEALIDAPEEERAKNSGAYLRQNGFSERVCAMAEAQPAAKRYLATTNATYKALFPEHTKMTLQEIKAFENHPYYKDVLNVCRWAASTEHKTKVELPLSFFRRLVWDHLSCRLA